MRPLFYPVLAALMGALIWALGEAPQLARAQSDIEMSPISGDPSAPRRHFRLRQPQELSPERANAIYDIVVKALEVGYARADNPAAKSYRSWKRYSTAPYLSSTHGNHYVSNYANETASAYGDYEDAGEMPVGSIIAKDSFSVAQTGEILLGGLSIMEKMPAGFNELTGDWRYTQILPDGTILGETNGKGDAAVDYCIGCHMAVEHQDSLYFIPKEYRVTTR